MDKVTNHITLDMSVERKQNVRCVIEDSDTRYIYIKITDKGKLYNFAESDIVWFRFVKPDGNIIIWKLGENSRFTKSNDELIVELNQDCTSAVGIGEAEIRIESYDNVNTEIITSMSFNIVIIKNVISNEGIASRSDFTDLVDYTTKDLVSSADLSVNVETSTMKLDLKNKKGIVIDTNTVKIPSGGSDVTSETVSNWGFVKNNNPSFTGNFSMNRKSGTTIGTNSVAEGTNCEASGDYSYAEGYYTNSKGGYSHSEGNYTEASGSSSHSEGQGSKAIGSSSHAEGNYTEASGFASHSEGDRTIARGDYSHAEGYSTTATGQYQHVQGKYNVEDTEKKYAHIVGGGKYREPKNIHTLDWNGNAEYAGDVIANGCGGDCPVSLVEISKVASSAIPSSEKGVANGVAQLDETGKVPLEQLPDISGVSSWTDIENKPFESIGSGLSVVDGVLSATGGGSVPSGSNLAVSVEDGILKFNESNTSNNVRYNEDTDKLEVLFNNIWTPVMNCNLKNTVILFDGEFKNQDLLQVNSYNTEIVNGLLHFNYEATSGIWTNIMPDGVSKIMIEVVGDMNENHNILQYGTCTSDASMPTILTSGTGRQSYNNEIVETKVYTLKRADTNGGVFVGGGDFYISRIWYSIM